ncbi:MAG: YqgE/AlgH family protein [Opitutaceae bacterium]
MRERRKGTKHSIVGSLLLAHPSMKDPNFRRAVVLMSAHNADGAMGVVMNRPLGKRLGELNGEFALGALAGVPLFCGGPVAPEQLLLVAWQDREDGFQLHFGIDPEKAIQLLDDGKTNLRAYLGYSGWSRGQLENELKQDTWIVTDIPGDVLDHSQNDTLWRKVLGGVGEEWKLLAEEPEDTSRN